MKPYTLAVGNRNINKCELLTISKSGAKKISYYFNTYLERCKRYVTKMDTKKKHEETDMICESVLFVFFLQIEIEMRLVT